MAALRAAVWSLDILPARLRRNLYRNLYRLDRQVDKAATSVVLNIAEGNGRYPEGDRRRFLDIAEASAVKAAAYLDLCVHNAELDPGQRGCGVQLLGRIGLMLRGLSLR